MTQTSDIDLSEENAPHVVRLKRPQPLAEIVRWWVINGVGRYGIADAEADDSPRIHAMRFTHADTAFWFKMRFG